MMKKILLDSVDSTNSYVAAHADELPSGCVVSARRQTAGRGQRGNSWESEPGKNLTFTMLFRPEQFPAIRQFRISQAVALAVCEALEAECGVECRVKWPNDIYVDCRKICGILISHSLSGSTIAHTVVGAGINVNQRIFKSDAPNPVSVWQLTGREYQLDKLLDAVASAVEREVMNLIQVPHRDEAEESLHQRFMNRLWRGDGGIYDFRTAPEGIPFRGIVEGIEPGGHLLVRDADSGELRRFAFKEVEWCL